MAEGDRSYKLNDLNLTIKDTTPPAPPKPPPPPDYWFNTLLIALVFETILLITFAKGDAGAAAPAQPSSQAIGDQDCRPARDSVVRILIRQRNIALRNAQAERGALNERAWGLVADVLDQIRDQVDDRLKPLTGTATAAEPSRLAQTKGCVYR